MNKAQNHKIHTAAFQVEFAGLEEGFGLQDQMGHFFKDRIVSIMTGVLDRFSDSDITTVIDRLELDLGTLYGENWEDQMLETFVPRLEDALRKAIAERGQKKPLNQVAVEVLMFFLEEGYFPWHSPFSSPLELEASLSLTQPMISKITATLSSSRIACTRFHQSFSVQFRMSLLEKHFDKIQDEIGGFLEFLEAKAEANPRFFQNVLNGVFSSMDKGRLDWGEILRRFHASEERLELSLLSDFFAAEWSRDKGGIDRFLRSAGRKLQGDSGEKINKIIGDVIKIRPDLKPEVEEIFHRWKAASKLETDQIFAKEKTETLERNAVDGIESGVSSALAVALDAKSADIFVGNAGLVLLHPFLPSLFEKIGLQKADKFLSRDSQMAAANVLQYLVWAEHSLSENHFPLIKLLIGMPINEVLDLGIDPVEGWKEACEELLSGVIGHWSVLKNTSAAGLRETFLQREGKLSPAEKGWRLQVESKTVDVLLGKLPWGIGIVKLPWMPELLYVDWK